MNSKTFDIIWIKPLNKRHISLIEEAPLGPGFQCTSIDFCVDICFSHLCVYRHKKKLKLNEKPSEF